MARRRKSRRKGSVSQRRKKLLASINERTMKRLFELPFHVKPSTDPTIKRLEKARAKLLKASK
jgi:transcriptional regulator GlxA family with amidase domain